MDKYIYLVLLPKYYLVRIIKMIFNNINDNGNVIMNLTGILTENTANIVSLLVKNFLNYQIQFDEEFEDISPRLPYIFNMTTDNRQLTKAYLGPEYYKLFIAHLLKNSFH